MVKISSSKMILSAGIVLLIVVVVRTQLPVFAAGGLLYPMRRHVDAVTPENCQDATFSGEDVTLRGCRCRAVGPKRGTIVYLHGVADNRVSAIGVIQRFVNRGFDVVAYDSRAHGESGGEIPVQKTLLRLMRQGLSRHDAHGIGRRQVKIKRSLEER
jgi:pimeloyl-ACP methyl ester carboxylesterase